LTTYISGAQHTANIHAYERKVDIPDEIKYLEQDLTPLLHLTEGRGKKKRVAINPEYRMLEKEPHGAWTAINYSTGYTDGATVLTVDSSAHIPIGAVLKVIGGEQLWVTAKTNATTVTVTRGFGATAAATIADNVPLYMIGTANEEKGAVPTPLMVQARGRVNYTQIFRKALGLSRTVENSELYGGKKRTDLRKESWLEFKKLVERAFLVGEPLEDTTGGAQGFPVRATGGAYYYVNAAGYVTSTTLLSKSVWMTAVRNCFRYGSRTKVALCAPYIIDVLSIWKDGKMEFKPSDDVYGLKVLGIRAWDSFDCQRRYAGELSGW